MDPRESSLFIEQKSEHVSINEDKLDLVVQMFTKAIQEGGVNSSDWLNQELHPKSRDAAAIEWVFVADTINFSFWTPATDKYVVTYKGTAWTGYFAGCACLNRALDQGIPITSATFYSTVSEEELGNIFRGDGGKMIPMLKERREAFQEVGEILLKNYDGSFYNLLKCAGSSAAQLLKLITDTFPCFRDEAVYKGETVRLWKRAQILVADVWRALESTGLGAFPDISSLTIFADYRIPQVLAFLGALEYSSELMEVLQSEKELKSGEEMEVEIRGCTIRACEMILDKVKRVLEEGKIDKKALYAEVNAVVIDNFLWCHRRAHAEEIESRIPFHRVRCIFY